VMVRLIQDQCTDYDGLYVWGIIHKECNLNSRYYKAKSQSKLEVQCLVLTTRYERCKLIKHTHKENLDLM
jgi:hypothetical protein